MNQEKIEYLPLDAVVATLQVRREFSEESLRGMAETFKSVGQQLPIKVRRDGDMFVIIDGERRYRAAKMAGFKTIAAIIEEQDLAPAAITHCQLVSNCQRDNLTPMEIAAAISELMDGTGWTATEAASQLGMSNATVSRLLALLKLPESIQLLVRTGEIAASAAYELGKIEDAAEQELLANKLVSGELSRDSLSGIVKRKGKPNAQVGSERPVRIKAELGCGYSVTVTGPGIHNLDDLGAKLEQLLGKIRKLRPKGLSLNTFVKLLRDEAKNAAGLATSSNQTS